MSRSTLRSAKNPPSPQESGAKEPNAKPEPPKPAPYGFAGMITASHRVLARALRESEHWGPTGARLLLGLVFAWFGYHELVSPKLWTGYVPILSPTSLPATLAVLMHGWVLVVLAGSLILGVLPRTAAAIGALLMLEIVVALSIHGLNDIVVRDIGVLGLAIVVSAQRRSRLALRW